MSYKCPVCKLEYSDPELAKQCQAWCSTHNSCNYLIARQAINKNSIGEYPQADDARYKDKS